MKWMTVQEYADFKGLSLAGAYKRVKDGRVTSEKKFGKLVVKVKEKEVA
jgi:hypothetical protein